MISNKKLNICVVDSFALNPGDLSWDELKQFGNVSIFDNTKQNQLKERVYDSHIVITNKVEFSSKTLTELPNLKCIVITATGYNNVDIHKAASLGITVCNAPNYSTPSVAQHVFALIMHLYNNVGDYTKETQQGLWNKSQCFCNITHQTVELQDKVIGIVGLGNIGMQVAEIAHAFNMKVIALTSKRQEDLPPYVTSVEKDIIFKESDILTLHIPLNSNTKYFVNESTIDMMKPSAIIINTARGNLINEQAMAKALNAMRITAYATDVLSTEPPSLNNPLIGIPNAYITPHIAWATKEARTRLIKITINNVRAFINGKPTNKIN